MHDTLQNLFRYKAWANDALLTALAKLGADSSITGLAIKALSHSYIVDRIFAAHMRRQPHAYTSVNLSDMPALEDLSADIRKSDRDYIDYVSALDRLCGDIALVDGISEEQAIKELEGLLKTGKLKGSA